MLCTKEFQMKMQKNLQLLMLFPKWSVQLMLLMIIPIQFFIVQMIALFYPNLTLCDQHRKFENTKIANFKRQVVQKKKMTTVPANLNAPISKTSCEKLK